ncbi:MAG TPA: hypothetical protein ENI55_02475 [Alphaproteobacteria bacterium]|nr:hypothetical protein [Alphaproteobacteria bacterium]
MPASAPPFKPPQTPQSLAQPVQVTPIGTPEADVRQAGEENTRAARLAAMNADGIGVLSDKEGGFGAAMWKGTERSLLDTLLPRLPVKTNSPAMRGLIRRLLLSAADAPQGKAPPGKLIETRVKLLASMGDLAAVNRLLDAVPDRAKSEPLARIEANSRFLANDNARACALAAARIGESDAPFWQKAFIFCQALAGENDKAALGVSLLREAGNKDEIFFSLIESLAGGTKTPIKSLAQPSALRLAVARAANVRLPADVISSSRPAILRTIAISPNAPVKVRLEAAERAEAAGALPVDALRQLYTSVSFSKEDLANPLSKAEAESGPLSRALLYRTALVQTVPTAQAEAVAQAFKLGRAGGRYDSMVRVFMPVLKRIPTSAEMVWFAPEAVRAFIAAGENDAAKPWFQLLRAGAAFNNKAKAALDALMPLARLAGSPEAGKWTVADLTRWLDTMAKDERRIERATLLYSLFDAVSDPVPEKLWDALLSGGPLRATVVMPNPAIWRRLTAVLPSAAPLNASTPSVAADNFSEQETDGGAFGQAVPEASLPAARPPRSKSAPSIGETVMLSLLALGEGGPQNADPIVLRRVLARLSEVGLGREARALAVEAALGAGL